MRLRRLKSFKTQKRKIKICLRNWWFQITHIFEKKIRNVQTHDIIKGYNLITICSCKAQKKLQDF